MSIRFNNEWWQRTWAERERAVKAVLGETDPPGHVLSVEWPKPELIIPGACIMHFRPTSSCKYILDITFGLSQPVTSSEKGRNFEVGVYSPREAAWQCDLLYQFLLHCSETKQMLRLGDNFRGYYFIGSDGVLYAGLGDPICEKVGEISSFYLYPDYNLPLFQTSTGSFRLLSCIGLTPLEEHLVRSHSLAHVLLAMYKAGLGLVCDPLRKSFLSNSTGTDAWNSVRGQELEAVVGLIKQIASCAKTSPDRQRYSDHARGNDD